MSRTLRRRGEVADPTDLPCARDVVAFVKPGSKPTIGLLNDNSDDGLVDFMRKLITEYGELSSVSRHSLEAELSPQRQLAIRIPNVDMLALTIPHGTRSDSPLLVCRRASTRIRTLGELSGPRAYALHCD